MQKNNTLFDHLLVQFQRLVFLSSHRTSEPEMKGRFPSRIFAQCACLRSLAKALASRAAAKGLSAEL